MLTPEQAAQKWRQRANAATDAIRAGVNAMTDADDPLKKAAAKEREWAEGCQRAAEQRKFSAGLNRTSFDFWKQQMLGKGLDNYRRGLESGETKWARFARSFFPYLQQGKDRLKSQFPRGTLDQNIARMNEMVRWNSQYRRGAMEFNIGGVGGGFR